MSLPRFDRLQTASVELNRVQDRVGLPLDRLTGIGLLDGVLVEDVEMASGLNILQHGLGREVRGYLLVRSDADVRVYDDATASPQPALYHRLQATAAATVSLWVF